MQPNFADHLLHSLSWTFIHSLWLGLILSVVAGVIILLTGKAAPSLRYILLTGSYFIFLFVLTCCFISEWNSFGEEIAGIAGAGGGVEVSGVFRQLWIRDLFSGVSGFMNANSRWIVLVWAVVLFFKAGKMIADLSYVSRMRSNKVCDPGEDWRQKIQWLADSVGVRRTVSLAESALVKSPVVIGHLKPLILMPVGIMARLSPGEVEAVLLHELAHIRRHDYLVNFIQRISELLLFFNPGLLWVSSLMRIEREHCCDDIAIEKTADRLQFAEALISFKEYSMMPQQYALGLFGRKSLLLQRMTRIVYKRNKTLSRFEFAFFAVSLFVLSLLLLGQGTQRLTSDLSYIPVTSSPQPDYAFSAKRLQLKKETEETAKNAVLRPAVKRTVKTVEVMAHEKKVAEHVGLIEMASADQQHEMEKLILEQKTQYRKDLEQHDLHKLEAEINRKEADANRRRAELDRAAAEQERARAEIDRKNAEKDREQADKNREQAERDRARAQQDRERAELDRAAAAIRRHKADEERRRLESSGHQFQ